MKKIYTGIVNYWEKLILMIINLQSNRVIYVFTKNRVVITNNKISKQKLTNFLNLKIFYKKI